MTSTVAQVLHRVRRNVMGTSREQYAALSGSHDASTTTITFASSPTFIAASSYIEVDLEIMVVTAYTAGATTATVIRGMLGSTAATHASGALVRINPVYYDFSALEAVNEELASLSGEGLFRVRTVALTATQANGYDLTSATDVVDVMDVRAEQTGSTKNWWRINRGDWEFLPGMSSADFASTYAIIFKGGHGLALGQEIRVFYKASFSATPLTATSDVVETVSGIHTEAVDLLHIGAAIRVLGGREVSRNFTQAQGDTRRPDEVPPGAITASLSALRALRQSRIATEMGRLRRRYEMG